MSEGMKSGTRWLRWVVEVFLVLTALAAVLAAAVGEARVPWATLIDWMLLTANMAVSMLGTVFLVVYMIRYRWERRLAGRAFTYGVGGFVMLSFVGLTRRAGLHALADTLALIAYAYLAAVLLLGIWVVVRPSPPRRDDDTGGSVLEFPHPSARG